MHSLLGECQRRCNLITEPQLVNTSFVGTACSVHREKAHCQSLKAFSSIRLHILFLWATESEICLTCDTDSIRACCNCWSVCLVSKLSNYSCVEIWWNSSFGKNALIFANFVYHVVISETLRSDVILIGCCCLVTVWILLVWCLWDRNVCVLSFGSSYGPVNENEVPIFLVVHLKNYSRSFFVGIK